MGAADTVMVSSIGEYAISAVNIVDNINNLLIIAFTALSTGGAVVVSQYIGRRDAGNAGLAARQLIYSVGAVSLALMGIGAGLRRPIIFLLYGNIAPEVMDAGALYFLVTALSYPFLAVYNAGGAIFRAAGNSKVTMRIALVVNVLNVGGNALFIYVFKIGVLGAALSTLISRAASALILLHLLVRVRRGPVNLEGVFKVRLVYPTIRRILNVGLPSGVESSMFQMGRLLTQRIFTSFGTGAFAANAVASVVNSFSFMPGMAYGMALLTVVGQCIGAGDYGAAKRYTARIMKLAYITIFVISLGIYLFMEPLLGLFSLSPEARELAALFLRAHCISMALGWGASFALPNALRAAGDARFVMIAASVSMWTVRVSAAYLLTYVFGIGPLGVWLAMGGDCAVRGTCYVCRWIGGRWQGKRVI
jgi:putative MATE family efflux protein